jgi:hypothetical protein
MNSIKAIAAGLIALAALLPVSAPAANIGVYAILKNHLDDEQIDAILHDMLHVSGNKSFRNTIGALMNLHQTHSMRRLRG